MQLPQTPKLRVPGFYTPGFRALEVPLPTMGNRQISTPRVFTDPVLNARVRQYYDEYENNLFTQLTGKAYGAGVGAGTGALIGSTIGAIVGLIATVAGAVSPIPGDEVAGASLLTSSMASFSAAGSKIGAGVGAVAGATVSDYRTYHAMNELIKNTVVQIADNPGAGTLNALYTVGKSMDIMSGGEAIRASIYSLVNGENALEHIAKAYGLTYDGRREYDTEIIRKSLGVDLGRFGNFVIDMFGDLVTDPGFVSAVGAMKLSSEAGQNLFKEALKKSVKEADAINNLFMEAADNPKLQKHLYKALLEKDYSTILTELAKREGATDITAKAVRKFVDTVSQEATKYTVNNVYNLFKNIDNMDDLVTGYLFKVALPPVAGITALKKGYKLIRNNISIVDGGTGSKLNYFIFGNNAKYTFEEYLDDELEKMYNKETMEWINRQYDKAGNVDTSKVIFEGYTANQMYRDVDDLKELQRKADADIIVKDEDIALKTEIEKRLEKAKEVLKSDLERINADIAKLDPNKVIDIKITDEGFDEIISLYKHRSHLEWLLATITDDSLTNFRKLMRDIQRVFSRAEDIKDKYGKHVRYEIKNAQVRKVFDDRVEKLIKLLNDNPDLEKKIRSRAYTRFFKMIRDNIDEGVKQSITNLFRASSETFEQARKKLDESYDVLKNKSEHVINRINNIDTSYKKYRGRTKLERPMTEEEYLQKQMKDIDRLNKNVEELNDELKRTAKESRLNVNSFLYRNLVNNKFILEGTNPFKYFNLEDSKKAYVELLDSIRRTIDTLNNLDLQDDEAKQLVDLIITPYTQYIYSVEMAPEVAALFQTDINISKIFDDSFNFDTFEFGTVDINKATANLDSFRKLTDSKKRWINNELKNKFLSPQRKKALEQYLQRVTDIQLRIENRSISFWDNLNNILSNNPNIADSLLKIILNKTQYNVDSMLTYLSSLKLSKTNPAVIIYLDHYISVFDKHIKRLKTTRSIDLKDLSKLRDLLDTISQNRSTLYNVGYDNKLFTSLRQEISTLDNYFTTQHMVNAIEQSNYNHVDNLINHYKTKLDQYKKDYEYLSKQEGFEDNITPKIKSLEQTIQDLQSQRSTLVGEVFEMNKHLSEVLQKDPKLFTVKDPTDYAFDFAVDSLISNVSKFTNDNGYRFSKRVASYTLSVLHQLASYDRLSSQLLNYIEPILLHLDYSDLAKVSERLEQVVTMANRIQLFRESKKVMNSLGITVNHKIDSDKLVVTLRDGTDLKDYFVKTIPQMELVKVTTDRRGRTLDVPYNTWVATSKQTPNFSFDASKFRKYLIDNKVDLEVNRIDINKLPEEVDVLKSNYVIPLDEVFQNTINGRDIIFSPKNNMVFNRKATAVNPKRFIYMDIEATNGDDKIGEALIQQLHLLEVDADGKVQNEITMFIDPAEYDTLTTRDRFSISDQAIEKNGIDRNRLLKEAANGNSKTLAGMKKAIEDFHCFDDDAVVIAHNGNGYDFGVLINNLYNDSRNALEVFDETGKVRDNIHSMLNMNCIDSLELTKALFNRGTRMTNAELAKASGIPYRVVEGAPNETNIINADEIVEYIYKKEGKVVTEQYFQGKPLHDAATDVRLMNMWSMQQIKELKSLIPEDYNFYDFITNPNDFIYSINQKIVDIDPIEFKKIFAKNKFNLEDSRIHSVVNTRGPEYIKFKKLVGRVFGYDGNFSYEEILSNVTHQDLSSVIVDLEDEYYLDTLFESLYSDVDIEGVLRSTIDHESDVYKDFRRDIDAIHSVLENYHQETVIQQNKVFKFISKNTNMGVQQVNRIYIQTALTNTILLDPGFNMFRNILSGNIDAFEHGNNYWVLAKAIQSIDNEPLKKAAQYFEDLYESAMWQNTFYMKHGTNNIDAIHQTIQEALKVVNDFDNVDEYYQYLKDNLPEFVNKLKLTKDSPVNLSESAVYEIIDYLSSKFGMEDYPIIIQGNLTNNMYKYIKEQIMDKIATAEDLNKILTEI